MIHCGLLVCGHPKCAWGQVEPGDSNEEPHCLWCGDIEDLGKIAHNCAVVYENISGGLVSKPLTDPHVVLQLADEHEGERWGEYLRDETQMLRDMIDRFGPLLANQGHVWTDEQRALFEEITESVGGDVREDDEPLSEAGGGD